MRPSAVWRQWGLSSPGTDTQIAAGHAVEVAGVMVSTHTNANTSYVGVSPDANLDSTALTLNAGPISGTRSLQFLAGLPGVTAINNSWAGGNMATAPDGNSQVTLGLDWTAWRYDVLHVVAGSYTSGNTTISAYPSDNFNGLTVAYSCSKAALPVTKGAARLDPSDDPIKDPAIG